MCFLLHDRSGPPLILVTHYRSGLQTSCPTMPSADSCPPVSVPYDTLSSECRTPDRPPGVSSAAFTTHLPDLPPRLLMVMAFAITCLLCQTGKPHIGFLFVRSWFLLHASFRLRLTTTPLRFTSPSPPSGWTGDFHPRAAEHARHTRQNAPTGVFQTADKRINYRMKHLSGVKNCAEVGDFAG
ncbi:hypothetical protein Dd1591_3499 [Dickeya chrysanthemi Ech1591]|uniref:Uncharacterized protein n=1 Tax=Dickeya chrysanthemi (strain Ech1591) TaxID=561229 RepID=C6CJS9_DICC1|nr:hypothetical protein Dd1591_3499 [Dickeya chrysanthemi Ech1591]